MDPGGNLRSLTKREPFPFWYSKVPSNSPDGKGGPEKKNRNFELFGIVTRHIFIFEYTVESEYVALYLSALNYLWHSPVAN
jgi:hypothetical protein